MTSNITGFYVIAGILLIGFLFVCYVFLIRPLRKRVRSKKNIEPAKKLLKKLDEKYPPDRMTPNQLLKRSRELVDSGFDKYTIRRAQLLNNAAIKKLNLKQGVKYDKKEKEKTIERQDNINLEEKEDSPKRTGTTRTDRRTEKTNRNRTKRNEGITGQRIFSHPHSKHVVKNKQKPKWNWEGFK